MGSYNTYPELVNAIDAALPAIMEGPIADWVKDVLQTTIEVYVYDPKKFPPSSRYHRRGENGGLLDKSLMVANYDPKYRELTVYSDAEGTYKQAGMRLDKMVENGGPFTWGGNAARRRPFYDKAEEEYLSLDGPRHGMEEMIVAELEKVL